MHAAELRQSGVGYLGSAIERDATAGEGHNLVISDDTRGLAVNVVAAEAAVVVRLHHRHCEYGRGRGWRWAGVFFTVPWRDVD